MRFARAAAIVAALAAAGAAPGAAAYDRPAAVASAPAAAIGDAGSEVVFRALSLLGVSYRFGGNTPETGLDCSGLVRLVFSDTLGLPLPRRSEEISRVGSEIAPSELQPGDLVFFNTLRRAFSHVGIYIGNNQFVHAPSAGRSIRVENLGADYWTRRFDGARRLLGQDLLAAASMNPVASSAARVMHASAAALPGRSLADPAPHSPAETRGSDLSAMAAAPIAMPTAPALSTTPPAGPARSTPVAFRPPSAASRTAVTRQRPNAAAPARPGAKPGAHRVAVQVRFSDLYVN